MSRYSQKQVHVILCVLDFIHTHPCFKWVWETCFCVYTSFRKTCF